MPNAPPLAVALDATLWDAPTTGIGQYARRLAEALDSQGVSVARLGAERSGDAPRGSRQGATAYVMGALPGVLSGRPEPLFHALGNFNLPLAPVPGKRFVLTVHDLIPELFPDTVSLAYRTQFRWWLSRSLHVADQVICVSHATATDLARLHPESRTPVTVVHHGADHARVPSDPALDTWLRGLALPEQFILYAGALDARKNVGLVLDALEQLRRAGRSVTLALIGQRWFGSSPLEERIERMRGEGFDLRPLGHQPEGRLYRLMQAATAFVFPSRYEGFGLPPLEAMQLGTPAIVARTGALPEVCGDAAMAVPEDAPEALAAAIARLLDDPAERKWRSEAGKRRASAFTWAQTATATRAVYEAALAG